MFTRKLVTGNVMSTVFDFLISTHITAASTAFMATLLNVFISRLLKNFYD